MRRDALYLRQMLDAAQEVVSLTDGLDRDAFFADRVLRLALVHLVQILGEAARRVPDDVREDHSDIPWREIVGMRNKIVHDYAVLDDDIVWIVVTLDLPGLLPILQGVVDDLGDAG